MYYNMVVNLFLQVVYEKTKSIQFEILLNHFGITHAYRSNRRCRILFQRLCSRRNGISQRICRRGQRYKQQL